MAIKVTELLRQEATAKVEYFDEKGEVKFRPGAITDDMFERVQAAAEADDENVLNKLLAEVCTWWDVVDEAGAMVPFTAEALKGLPIPFKSAVLEQVIEQARGNPKPSAATSRGGSRRNGR